MQRTLVLPLKDGLMHINCLSWEGKFIEWAFRALWGYLPIRILRSVTYEVRWPREDPLPLRSSSLNNLTGVSSKHQKGQDQES